VGTVLLALPGAYRSAGSVGLVNALFTATSAVCVTGLITVNTVEFTRYGQLVILGLIQAGGLGIITFSSANIAGTQRRMSLGNRKLVREFYVASVDYEPRRITRNIVLTTLALEAVGFVILTLSFRAAGVEEPVYHGFFHAISAFCNAGFSTFSDSLGSFTDRPVLLTTIMLLIILGGLGFVVMQDLARSATIRRHRLSLHTRIMLVGTPALIVLGGLAYWLLERGMSMRDMDAGRGILNAAFQAVTPRTAGFSTVPQAELSVPSRVLTFFLMFVGGGSGSIAGGIRVTTFALIIISVFKSRPHDRDVRMGARKVSGTQIRAAQDLSLKAIIVLLVAIFLLALTENPGPGTDIDLEDIAFEVFSAFGTVGLSTGLTPNLSLLGKLVVTAVMYTGRVGLVAMAMPRRETYNERFVDVPNGEVRIG
jgi:trk system potassium uptake protein TrkH